MIIRLRRREGGEEDLVELRVPFTSNIVEAVMMVIIITLLG